MDRNKKIGLAWLIGPIATLILSLILHAITIYVTQALFPGNNPEAGRGVARIVSMVLSLAGMFSVIGIIVGVPIGVVYLKRAPGENEVGRLAALPAYAGLTPEQIQYISRWSWGAFLAGVIWPLGNRMWLWAVLTLVPVVNLYAWIKLSISGRQMAWEKGGWQNFEQFKKRQTIVAWVAVAVSIMIIIFEVANRYY